MAKINSIGSTTAAPSRTPPTNLTHNQTVSSSSISPETAAVIVAIIVPLVVSAIMVLCFFQIKKHWKMRQAESITTAVVDVANSEPVGQSDGVQLYLQDKAELSVERSGHDMQPEGEIYELMNHDQCQEMPGEHTRQALLSLGERHEMRGEDHAREMDTSQDHDPRRDTHGYSFDEPMFVDFNESILSLRRFA